MTVTVTLSLVFYLAACICFGLAVLNIRASQMQSLGLLFLTLALLVSSFK